MGDFANIPAAGDAYLNGTVEEEPEVESTDELEDSTKDGKYVQYPALSLRLRSPNKPPPTCIQTLNPQIKLGNSNIWAIYLVVYDL